MHISLPIPKNKYLLALSGGIDSCVLFHLLIQQDISFEAAHVNFKLRGESSDKDEQFVKDLCEQHGIRLHSKVLDVNLFKEQMGVSSTQIVARDLRYDWFFELKDNYGYDFILTAHHLNDSIETFFINLMRGAGINGLLGIKNNAYVLRPLLSYSKEQLIAYATNQGLLWREDASNESDAYVRNEIRHHVIPRLNKIRPTFEKSFEITIDNLQRDKGLIDDYIEDIRCRVSETKNGIVFFKTDALIKPKYKKALFHLFSPYGFYAIEEIEKLLVANNSAEIRSQEYRLVKDRSHLILAKIIDTKPHLYDIQGLDTKELPIFLRLKTTDVKRSVKISFDFYKIKFPLSLRLKKSGDVFYPKGMHGKSKKVSKYFKDLKLSKIEKENTWLLCDAEDRIIWIVGHQQDERFISTNKTTKWLIAEN